MSDARSIDPVNQQGYQGIADAITQSNLIANLERFRESSNSVDSQVAVLKAARNDRAGAMLELLRAKETFITQLSTGDSETSSVLHNLQLGELLSKSYWHRLLSRHANNERNDKELAILSERLSAVVATNPTSESTHSPVSPVGVIAAAIAGSCALLLAILFAGLFAPGVLNMFVQGVSSGSTIYRLLMLGVVLLLTISSFVAISLLIARKQPVTEQPADESSESGLVATLFDLGASWPRIIVGALGPIFLGLGSGISISAGFGAFGFSVLLDGLQNTFGIPFWLSQTEITAFCYLGAWVWARIPLGLGTLTTLLLIGPSISVGVAIAPEGLGFLGNLVAFVVGLLLFAGGIAMAAAAALGPDGVTALSLSAERKQGWPVPAATFLWDITAILAGIVLGGNFGAATLIGLFAVPLLLYVFIPPLRRMLG